MGVGNWFGYLSDTHVANVSITKSGFGCRKKGMLYLGRCARSAPGFTTLCAVDGSRLLLSRCSMSPMLHVTHPGGGLTSNHVLSLRKI